METDKILPPQPKICPGCKVNFQRKSRTYCKSCEVAKTSQTWVRKIFNSPDFNILSPRKECPFCFVELDQSNKPRAICPSCLAIARRTYFKNLTNFKINMLLESALLRIIKERRA